MFNYAQLDSNDIVVGVSSLSGEVTRDNMIPIQFADEELIGKKYNRETGDFE